MSCHQWSNTLVGPSFVTIAQKYKGQKNIMDGLIQKVIDGGAGTFGHIPMNPHPQHSKEEIEKNGKCHTKGSKVTKGSECFSQVAECSGLDLYLS